jgi:hypothetical protein
MLKYRRDLSIIDCVMIHQSDKMEAISCLHDLQMRTHA